MVLEKKYIDYDDLVENYLKALQISRKLNSLIEYPIYNTRIDFVRSNICIEDYFSTYFNTNYDYINN